jgi:hypothetical protein
LGSCRSLGTTELQMRADMLYGFEIEEEVLSPLSGALAYSDELGGLQMGVGERGFRFPLHSKGGEVGEDFCEFGKEQIHGIAHEDELSVVGHIAARCLRS